MVGRQPRYQLDLRAPQSRPFTSYGCGCIKCLLDECREVSSISAIAGIPAGNGVWCRLFEDEERGETRKRCKIGAAPGAGRTVDCRDGCALFRADTLSGVTHFAPGACVCGHHLRLCVAARLGSAARLEAAGIFG